MADRPADFLAAWLAVRSERPAASGVSRLSARAGGLGRAVRDSVLAGAAMTAQQALSNNAVLVVYRDAGDGRVYADVFDNGCARRPLSHVARHSPDGFEFGYAGSGPADLALSILTACRGPETAERLYQRYKAEVIAGIVGRSWTTTAGAVRAWADGATEGR